MKLEEFYVVYKPAFDSEKTDIFSGQKTTIQNLCNQFHGGLTPEMIQGIYTKKSEAEKEAEILFQKVLSMRDDENPFSFPKEIRFKKFVLALEELSTKFGIAIQSTGGLTILNERMKIGYSKDHTSGDLDVYY